MISSTLFFFIITSIITNHVTLADDEIVTMHSCLNSDNYTTKSIYAVNLAFLLATFSHQTQSQHTFYNIRIGQEPDKVYGSALCRGDLSPEACAACVKNSTTNILTLCPNQKRGFAWFDLCMIRYSDKPMHGVLEQNDVVGHWNEAETETKNGTMFAEKLYPLLTSLRERAGSGGPTLKAAEGNVTLGGPMSKIYALSQCSPDLSEGQCLSCLATIEDYVRKWSYANNYTKGARFCVPSCYLRYETYRFYESIASDVTSRPPDNPLASPSGPSHSVGPPDSEGKKKTSASRVAIFVLVPAFSFVILVACVWVILKRRSSHKNVDDALTKSLHMELGIVRDATDGFSVSNKLGQGGFGPVYKGKLPDGRYIAVKKLSAHSGQGDEEFKNEVRLVTKLKHKNLVRVLGYCLEKQETLLIYEFVQNSSLDHHIFDPIKGAQLDWRRRYNIIKGIVRGLLYLHEESRLRIIHRDLKAGNVLLDSEMVPKIADFGLARLVALDQTHWNTTKIAGTCGYMAPEYAYKGHFSVKSDVFSFGVLVLEIVAGQKNGRFKDEDFKSYAWKSWRQGRAMNMVDPTLMRECDSMSEFEMEKCIQIGLLCVQEHAASRPSMASVDLMLNSDSATIAAPEKPAFFVDSAADYGWDWSESTGLSEGTSEEQTTITLSYDR